MNHTMRTGLRPDLQGLGCLQSKQGRELAT